MRIPALALMCASITLLCGLRLPAAPGDTADVDRLEDLIDEGKYEAAFGAFQFALGNETLRGDSDALVMRPYRAKWSVEVGALQEAVLILKQGDPAWADVPFWAPRVARERAALLLALGEYRGAAENAAKGYRLCAEQHYLKIRIAYCKSLEAQARLRLGDVSAADQASKAALEIARKYRRLPPFFYAPRIFYTACLVQSYSASPGGAEAECRRGIALAEGTGGMRRDVSLGYLALAEACLRSGNLTGSREAALYSLRLTHQMFGTKHQDAVGALQILAQMNLKEGNPAAARSNAEEAVSAGLAVFGDGSARVTELRRDLAPCLAASK